MNKKLIVWGIVICLILITAFSAISDKGKPEIVKKDYTDLKITHIFAEVEFKEKVSSYDSDTKLKSNAIVERNKVKISHSDLKNKKAKITFKLSNIKNPVLFRNGVWVKDAKITKKGLTDWVINVNHFSVYEIKENNFIGEMSNTTLSNGNLTLESDAIFIADFEDIEDVADRSIYSNNIDDYTPSVTDQCKFGNSCYKWDGVNDYIEAGIDDDSDIYGTLRDEISVCAWINTSTVGDINNLVSMAFFGSSLSWSLYEVSNKLRFGIRDDSANYAYAIDPDSPILDRWVSVCGTRNVTHVGLYVDGVIKASTATVDSGFIGQAHELVIGGIGQSSYVNPVGTSKASIQCVQIFSNPLSYDNIVKINNSLECLEGSLVYDTIVDAYQIDIGDDDGGNLASLQTFGDGDFINVGEVTGVPGIDMKMEFTGLSNGDLVKRVFMNVSYDGNGGHMIEFFVLDTTINEFVPLEPIPETMGDFVWVNATIPNFFDIIDDSGKITFGVNHTSSGNQNHELHIDYIGIELEQPISSWNISTDSKVIPDHYGVNDLDAGAYFNGTGALNSIGAYEFDGVDDTLSFLVNNELEWVNNQSHTFSYWYNQKGDTSSTVGTIYSDLSGQGIWIYISNDGSVKYRFDSYTCTYVSGHNDNEWYYITHTWNPTLNEMKTYVDGVLKTTCTSDNGFRTDTGSFSRLGGENDGGNYFFNGTIDEFKIFNRTLTQTEITELYNTNPLSKYDAVGKFTNITEGSKYQSQTQANLWQYVGLNSSDCSDVFTLSTRTGDCDTITGETYLPTIQNGCIFNIFGGGTSGDCIDFELILNSDTSTSIHISNYNISVNMTFLPSVNNTDIWGGQNNSAPLYGNFTFKINDTDLGWVNVSWYSNGLYSTEELFYGLGDGDIQEAFTLADGMYSKGEVIYFVACPYIGSVSGTCNQSSNITIGNAGFAIDSYYPEDQEVSIKKSQEFTFYFTLNDTDGDANIRWYINGELVSNEMNFTFYSQDYALQDNPLRAEIYDDDMTIEHSWNITSLDPYSDNGASFLVTGIFYLFITSLVTFVLYKTKKMWLKVVFANALALMLVTLLRFSSWFISITHPEQLNLINTLDIFYGFGVRAMYFIVAGSCLFLVVLIINMIKISKSKRRKDSWDNWGDEKW